MPRHASTNAEAEAHIIATALAIKYGESGKAEALRRLKVKPGTFGGTNVPDLALGAGLSWSVAPFFPQAFRGRFHRA